MTYKMAYKGYKNSHKTITHNLHACCPNSLLFLPGPWLRSQRW